MNSFMVKLTVRKMAVTRVASSTGNTETDIIYRCRKCRVLVDVQDAIIKSCKDSCTSHGTTIDLDTDNCPDWILDAIIETGWTRGKLNCVKCSGRLGSFDFLKTQTCQSKDGCYQHSAVHILQNRVDVITSRFNVASPRIKDSVEGEAIWSTPSGLNISPRLSKDRSKHLYRQSPIRHSSDTLSVQRSQLFLTGLDQANCDITAQDSLDTRSSGHPLTLLLECEASEDEDYLDMAAVCDYIFADSDVNKSSTLSSDDASVMKRTHHKGNLRNSPIHANRFSLLEPSVRELRSRKHVKKLKGGPVRFNGDSIRRNVLSSTYDDYEDLANHSMGERFKTLVYEEVPVDNKNTAKTMEEPEVPVEHSCPVCLDLLYSAYKCRPCGHVFCEICLRKVANLNQRPGLTMCPLCRKVIQTCVQDTDLSHMLKSQYPIQYKARRLEARQMKTKNFPLPKCSVREYTTRNIRHLVYDTSFWNRFVQYQGIFILLFIVIVMFTSIIYIGKCIFNAIVRFFF